MLSWKIASYVFPEPSFTTTIFTDSKLFVANKDLIIFGFKPHDLYSYHPMYAKWGLFFNKEKDSFETREKYEGK